MNGSQKKITVISLVVLICIAIFVYLVVIVKQNTTLAQNPLLATTTSLYSSSAVKIGKVAIDSQSVQELQSAIDQGHQPWRTNPVDVAIVDSQIYPSGLASIDDTSPTIQKISLNTKTGVAVYVLPFQGKQYMVTVVQPVVGTNKIWVVSDIENTNSTTTTTSFTFVSPTKNDIWNIGEEHKITFNQPIPYDAHCVNTVYLVDSKGNHVGEVDVKGDNLSLEKGATSITWDTKTLFSSHCGTSNTNFDVKTGIYRLELHDEDTGYGIGKPIDVYSNYFNLQ